VSLVRANTIERVLEIETDIGSGTAFTIDVDGQPYLVTARHLLPPDSQHPHVRLKKLNASWSLDFDLLPLRVAADVAVAQLEEPLLREDLALPASFSGLAYSQQLYFLGFPFGLGTQMAFGDPESRVAFVKAGILSASAQVAGVDQIYVDGHNNPGFSGGPVVGFAPGATQEQVCGVVSGYRYDPEPVYVGSDQTADLSTRSNTGIVIATSIHHVLDAIADARPS
jgi:S1-C subfamily serine protease